MEIIMATNELNNEVATSTFATPEPTELERLQQRIADFKVNVTPQVAQFSQILMQQALQNPTKIEDLDAFVTIRNELKEGLDEYQTQLANANKRMVELTEKHNQQKQMELARVQQDLQDARNAERKRRKDAEERARQLEAVMASHGIRIDLDGDGQIGLQEGETAEPLDAEQQKSLKELLDESKAAVGGTSPAFARARSMNPEPSVSEELQSDLEPISTAPITSTPTVSISAAAGPDYGDAYSNPEIITTGYNAPFDTAGPDTAKPEVVLPVPTDAKGTEDFLKEVEVVDLSDEDTTEEPVEEVGFDANGTPTSDFDVPQSETTGTIGITKKPVISDSDNPAVIKAEVSKAQPLNVRIVPEEEIADFESRANGIKATDFPTTEHDESDDLEALKKVEEEEFEEVVVPTESELKGMTKSKIRAEALKLGFDTVSTKDSKTEMITQFTLATEQFINDLQDSGEFVSANEEGEDNEISASSGEVSSSSNEEGEDNETEDTTDVRDGGYFN